MPRRTVRRHYCAGVQSAEVLIVRPEIVVSRQKLISSAFPKRKRATYRTVDNCIARLRQKIESDLAGRYFYSNRTWSRIQVCALGGCLLVGRSFTEGRGASMGVVTRKQIGMQLLGLGLLLAGIHPAYGIPAFALKFGLPCSACHEAWPMLNNFGQTFKDNGYQLGNDRDAPIYQEPGYWPIMFRTTPVWHREHNNRQAVDRVPGDPAVAWSSRVLVQEVLTSAESMRLRLGRSTRTFHSLFSHILETTV